MEASIAGNYVNIAASGTVKNAPGELVGFYVNSTTSGTVELRDGGAAGTVISGTITPNAGWHWFPARFTSTLHATIGGTLNVTFIVK